jgi:hypothetical protein
MTLTFRQLVEVTAIPDQYSPKLHHLTLNSEIKWSKIVSLYACKESKTNSYRPNFRHDFWFHERRSMKYNNRSSVVAAAQWEEVRMILRPYNPHLSYWT